MELPPKLELYLLYMASKHKSSKRKGRRKSSDEFSEKSNPSPDGKKPRNESIEGDEDEVLIALNMVEQINERLDQVLSRLEALE